MQRVGSHRFRDPTVWVELQQNHLLWFYPHNNISISPLLSVSIKKPTLTSNWSAPPPGINLNDSRWQKSTYFYRQFRCKIDLHVPAFEWQVRNKSDENISLHPEVCKRKCEKWKEVCDWLIDECGRKLRA